MPKQRGSTKQSLPRMKPSAWQRREASLTWQKPTASYSNYTVSTVRIISSHQLEANNAQPSMPDGGRSIAPQRLLPPRLVRQALEHLTEARTDESDHQSFRIQSGIRPAAFEL